MATGSPKYDTPEELESTIDDYFQSCKEKEERPLISGIAYYCGFESRQSFYDYENRKPFSYIIKRARLHIEMFYEENIGNGAGFIFGLKQFGWKDERFIDNTVRFDDLEGKNLDDLDKELESLENDDE